MADDKHAGADDKHEGIPAGPLAGPPISDELSQKSKTPRRLFLGFLVALGVGVLHVPLLWHFFGPRRFHWHPIDASLTGPFPEVKRFSLKKYDHDANRRKYIRPDEVIVHNEEPGELLVIVRFTFAGPELATRRIFLTIKALDDAGRVIARSTVRCSDQRIEANNWHPYAAVKLWTEPANIMAIPLSVPLDAGNKIHRVRVLLREA
jgi:hypothetical protein